MTPKMTPRKKVVKRIRRHERDTGRKPPGTDLCVLSALCLYCKELRAVSEQLVRVPQKTNLIKSESLQTHCFPLPRAENVVTGNQQPPQQGQRSAFGQEASLLSPLKSPLRNPLQSVAAQNGLLSPSAIRPGLIKRKV